MRRADGGVRIASGSTDDSSIGGAATLASDFDFDSAEARLSFAEFVSFYNFWRDQKRALALPGSPALAFRKSLPALSRGMEERQDQQQSC